MTPNNSDVFDTSGKGTFSANGKMPMFNKPVATPQTAAMNQASLKSAIAKAMGAKQNVQEDNWEGPISNASQLASFLNTYQQTGQMPAELAQFYQMYGLGGAGGSGMNEAKMMLKKKKMKALGEDWTDGVSNATDLANLLNQYQNTGEIPAALQGFFDANNIPYGAGGSGGMNEAKMLMKKKKMKALGEDWTDGVSNATDLSNLLNQYQQTGEIPAALQAFFDANQIPVGSGGSGMNEDYLSSLFDGENLSEEFKFKTQTIFEAAINEKVSFIEENILQASKEIIEEQVIANTQEIVEHVDQYLNYVINEWMEENKVAVERGLRTEIAENFINGLKDLFESSFIDVPQEKYNVLDDLFVANDELKENLNSLMKENISLKNEINARLCAEAFMEETAGLADTQIEKLAKLAEGIEFENPDQYRQKVSLLKESYFNHGKAVSARRNEQFPMLTEDMDSSSVITEGAADPMISSVVNTISVLNKNSPKVEKVYNTPSSARLAGLINQGIAKDNFI